MPMPMPTLSTAVLHESTRRWGTALRLGWDIYTNINIYRDFFGFSVNLFFSYYSLSLSPFDDHPFPGGRVFFLSRISSYSILACLP